MHAIVHGSSRLRGRGCTPQLFASVTAQRSLRHPLLSTPPRLCPGVLCHAALLQFVFMARKASCPACAPLTFSTRTPTAALTGLEPGTAYNISVVGVNKWGTRTPGSNTLLMTTSPGVRLTAAKATGPNSGSATAVGTPASGFASYVFTLKSAACPSCKPLTFSSKTPTVAFTKLEPATKVSGWEAGGRAGGRAGGQDTGKTGLGAQTVCPHVAEPAGVHKSDWN